MILKSLRKHTRTTISSSEVRPISTPLTLAFMFPFCRRRHRGLRPRLSTLRRSERGRAAHRARSRGGHMGLTRPYHLVQSLREGQRGRPRRMQTTGRWGLCVGRLSEGRRGLIPCYIQEVSVRFNFDPVVASLLRFFASYLSLFFQVTALLELVRSHHCRYARRLQPVESLGKRRLGLRGPRTVLCQVGEDPLGAGFQIPRQERYIFVGSFSRGRYRSPTLMGVLATPETWSIEYLVLRGLGTPTPPVSR